MMPSGKPTGPVRRPGRAPEGGTAAI